MTFLAKLKEIPLDAIRQCFDFGSDYNLDRFLKWAMTYKGRIRIEPDEAISTEARGYFEGAIVPTFVDHQEHLSLKNREDIEWAREFLKRNFNGRFRTLNDGTVEKVGMSTVMSKKYFQEFIDRVCGYFAQNAIPIPNPNLYKQWRDEHGMDLGSSYYEYLQENNLKVDGSKIEE